MLKFDPCEICTGVLIAWVEHERPLHVPDRLINAPGLRERPSQIAVCERPVRRQVHCLLQMGDRLSHPPARKQPDTQFLVRLCELGIQRQRPPE